MEAVDLPWPYHPLEQNIHVALRSLEQTVAREVQAVEVEPFALPYALEQEPFALEVQAVEVEVEVEVEMEVDVWGDVEMATRALQTETIPF